MRWGQLGIQLTLLEQFYPVAVDPVIGAICIDRLNQQPIANAGAEEGTLTRLGLISCQRGLHVHLFEFINIDRRQFTRRFQFAC